MLTVGKRFALIGKLTSSLGKYFKELGKNFGKLGKLIVSLVEYVEKVRKKFGNFWDYDYPTN